jgi:hypothetical protein
MAKVITCGPWTLDQAEDGTATLLLAGVEVVQGAQVLDAVSLRRLAMDLMQLAARVGSQERPGGA